MTGNWSCQVFAKDRKFVQKLEEENKDCFSKLWTSDGFDAPTLSWSKPELRDGVEDFTGWSSWSFKDSAVPPFQAVWFVRKYV